MRNAIHSAGLVLTLCLAAATSSSAQIAPAPQASLLALSKQDHTLAIIDPATLKVIAKIPVGDDPHEVTASTDGATAYVSNYGFGAFHTLAVVDLIDHKPLPSIDLGALRGPHGLAFAGGKVWFTAEVAKAIGRYDPSTHKVDWILGTGQNRTHMIYVAPNLQHIVTTNVNSGTVSLIDMQPTPSSDPSAYHPPTGANAPQPPSPGPRADWNETILRVGNGSEGFDVSPDNTEIWVANAKDGTLSIIDYPDKKVVQTLAVNVHGANRLKFTPDGKRVLVSAGPDLVVLNATTRKVIKRIPIGTGSGGVLIQPDGKRAFVSCSPDNYIAVIDLDTLKVTSHINVGPNPDGLAWAIHH